MQSYIDRKLHTKILQKLDANPVVALLGPRQCGKSTLIKRIIKDIPSAIYLDLEKLSDLRKLDNPEIFFEHSQNRLICLDEIQRKPDLFPAIRSFVDEQNRTSQFLILGSASPELIRQSSESLAGRIAYLHLTPFFLKEVEKKSKTAVFDLWLKGGFPRSYLQANENESYDWRENFIRTFLERDIPQFGFRISPNQIERFWRMLAHTHAQVFNSSKLSESLGVSYHTVRTYLSILEQTFLVRTLSPYEANIKKRLVKSPKVYIRDSGLLHTLLEIESFDKLLGNPSFGSSWEGFVIENILVEMPRWRPFFYRTATGVEIDLILEKGNQKIAIECKASKAPKIGKGFRAALKQLSINEAWIIAPLNDSYKYDTNITISGLSDFLQIMKDK